MTVSGKSQGAFPGKAPSVYKIKKILKKALTKVKSCCRIAIVVKMCAFSSAG